MDPNAAPQQPVTPPAPEAPAPAPAPQPTPMPAAPTPESSAPDHLAGPESPAAMQPTPDSAPAAPGAAMPMAADTGKHKMLGVLLIVFGVIVLAGLAYLGYTAFLKK